MEIPMFSSVHLARPKVIDIDTLERTG